MKWSPQEPPLDSQPQTTAVKEMVSKQLHLLPWGDSSLKHVLDHTAYYIQMKVTQIKFLRGQRAVCCSTTVTPMD